MVTGQNFQDIRIDEMLMCNSSHNYKLAPAVFVPLITVFDPIGRSSGAWQGVASSLAFPRLS